MTVTKIRCLFLLIVGSAFFLTSYSFQGYAKESTGTENNDKILDDISNKTLADYQNQLLEIAFETAAKIPIHPHIKDRCRAQEKIVDTCFKLDQPQKVLEYIKKIDNWRRGLGYAKLAFYCVRHGLTENVQQYLDFAEKVAEGEEDWRRDRIRVKIAQTHTWLGQYQLAEKFEAGVVDSESGKVAQVKAMKSDEESFHDQIKELDVLLESGNFDLVNNALKACAELFNRFYDDAQRRSLLEEKIKSSWNTVPIFFRIELLMQLAEFALEHSDRSKALELTNHACLMFNKYQWRLEHRISMMARLAELQYRSGDTQKARDEADAALDLFEKQGSTIVNIWRAGALRPLAEAYQAMGETERALSVYKRAIEEGVENPNSRPRAEDLSATCASMALHAVEPDSELWARIHQIYEGLDHPW